MTENSEADPHRYTPGAGIPVALPLGSSGNALSPNDQAASSESRGTNTSRTPFSKKHVAGTSGRVGAVALDRLNRLLPTRDRHVLERVREHRYLSTHQIQEFVFTTHQTQESAARTTRSVLLRLERSLLLRPLERRIGGVRAGSSAQLWQLTPAAARLLLDEGSTYRTHEPSPRFLGHCLAVADVHLALRRLTSDDDITDVGVSIEPTSWRRYSGSGGESRWLQPDLAAVVSTNHYDDRWFIEVDLGTESLPTLLRKCGQYEAYRASGIEQEASGGFPLVLWVFTKPQRAEQLARSVLRSPRLTPQLFRYAGPSSLLDVLRGDDR
jgi:hypothetical protein